MKCDNKKSCNQYNNKDYGERKNYINKNKQSYDKNKSYDKNRKSFDKNDNFKKSFNEDNKDKNYQNKFNNNQKYKKDFSNGSPFSKDRDSIYEVKHYPKKHKAHNSMFDIPMTDYEIDKERQRQKREMDKKRPKNKKYRIYEDY